MEHNFGHGKDGLSNTLMTLNLIAFAFHAVCDQLCELWRAGRDRYSRRGRLFLSLDVLNEWQYFDDWHDLLSRFATPGARGPP